MKTNFFKIINHLQSPGSWTIHISPVTSGKMVVSVLLSDPTSEKEGIVLSPMIFNETPDSLDNGFFEKIMQPVAEVNELFTNAQQVQKSIEAGKKKLEEKAKTTVPAPPKKVDDSAEKKQKYEEAIKKIGELNATCKYSEAISLLPNSEDYPDKKADLEKLRTELETKNQQLSLL